MRSLTNEPKIQVIAKAIQPLYSSNSISMPTLKTIKRFVPDILKSVRFNKPEFTKRLNGFSSTQKIPQSQLISVIYKSLHWTEQIKCPEQIDLVYEEFKIRVQEHEDNIYRLLRTKEALEVFETVTSLAKITLSLTQYQAFINILDKNSCKSRVRFQYFLRLLSEWFLENKPELARIKPLKELTVSTYTLLIFTIVKDYVAIRPYCQNIVESKFAKYTILLEKLLKAIKTSSSLESLNLSLSTIRTEIVEILNIMNKMTVNEEVVNFYVIQLKNLNTLSNSSKDLSLEGLTRVISPIPTLEQSVASEFRFLNEKSTSRSILKTNPMASSLTLAKNHSIPSIGSSHFDTSKNESMERSMNKSVRFGKEESKERLKVKEIPIISLGMKRKIIHKKYQSDLIKALNDYFDKMRGHEELEDLRDIIAKKRRLLLNFWSKENPEDFPKIETSLQPSMREELIMSEILYFEKLIEIEGSLKNSLKDNRTIQQEKLDFRSKIYKMWNNKEKRNDKKQENDLYSLNHSQRSCMNLGIKTVNTFSIIQSHSAINDYSKLETANSHTNRINLNEDQMNNQSAHLETKKSPNNTAINSESKNESSFNKTNDHLETPRFANNPTTTKLKNEEDLSKIAGNQDSSLSLENKLELSDSNFTQNAFSLDSKNHLRLVIKTDTKTKNSESKRSPDYKKLDLPEIPDTKRKAQKLKLVKPSSRLSKTDCFVSDLVRKQFIKQHKTTRDTINSSNSYKSGSKTDRSDSLGLESLKNPFSKLAKDQKTDIKNREKGKRNETENEIGKTKLNAREIVKVFEWFRSNIDTTENTKLHRLIEFYSFKADAIVILDSTLLKIQSFKDPEKIKLIIQKLFEDNYQDICFMDIFKRFANKEVMKLEEYLQFCYFFSFEKTIAPQSLKFEFSKMADLLGQIDLNSFIAILRFIAQEMFNDTCSISKKLENLYGYLEKKMHMIQKKIHEN